MDRFFQTWYDDRHYWTLDFDTWMALAFIEFHSVHENTKTSAQRFLANFLIDLDRMNAATTCYFV